MGLDFTLLGRIGVLSALIAAAAAGAVRASPSLAEAVIGGKPLIDIRARYEAVSDDNCAACRDATAQTLRARLGYETGDWHGLSVLFAFDQIWTLGPEDYNSKSNGRARYAVVADPTLTALDRLALTWRSGFDTTFVGGRQAITLDDARFIGNVGFRQHEQTFDAIKLVNTSIADATITYAWIGGVNRVFGPGGPPGAATGHFTSDSHVINIGITANPQVKLTAYAYLLDLKQAATASTATYALRGQWSGTIMQGVKGDLTGAYAHQSDYGNNPNSVSLDYWTLAGDIHLDGFTAGAGYEAMGGNGKVGFATPLATLHAFDGWADLFLTTPKDGIDDFYAKAGYKFVHAMGSITLIPLVIYHSFTTDRTGAHLGNEWDLALTAIIDRHLSLEASYAAYRGAGTLHDKTITWLTATFRS